MAALKTAVADIIEPTITAQYFLEETTSRSALIQAGIMATTPEITDACQQGGRTVKMPFWDDLPNSDSVASSVATDDDTAITPTGVTTDYDQAVKIFRTKAWNTSPVVKYVAGDDPLRVFMDRYVNWWVRERQRILLKTLYGIFADSTIATALSKDISGEVTTTDAAKLIGTSAIEDARFLLGDAYNKFTGIMMHSVPFKRLRSLGLIDTVPEQNQSMLAPGDYYQGLRVIVDDDSTKVAGSTSGYKYHTYLFGQGAIAFDYVPLEGEDVPFEVYREPLKGTGWGSTTVITRQGFIMHPRGVRYGGSLTVAGGPSDSDLSSDNWTQVFATKNIRIARLITNG